MPSPEAMTIIIAALEEARDRLCPYCRRKVAFTEHGAHLVSTRTGRTTHCRALAIGEAILIARYG